MAHTGAPLLKEVSRHAPIRAVFVDSFEFVGELPFTPSFLETFRAHVGYELTPYLPLVFHRGGESKYIDMADFLDVFGLNGHALYVSANDPLLHRRVREDYEEVRRFLFATRFVDRIAKWVRQRGCELRLQAHDNNADANPDDDDDDDDDDDAADDDADDDAEDEDADASFGCRPTAVTATISRRTLWPTCPRRRPSLVTDRSIFSSSRRLRPT